jgi:hypothetical protein
MLLCSQHVPLYDAFLPEPQHARCSHQETSGVLERGGNMVLWGFAMLLAVLHALVRLLSWGMQQCASTSYVKAAGRSDLALLSAERWMSWELLAASVAVQCWDIAAAPR